jgi:hypothetical protein
MRNEIKIKNKEAWFQKDEGIVLRERVFGYTESHRYRIN